MLLGAAKAGLNTFFSRLQTFFFFLNIFQWFLMKNFRLKTNHVPPQGVDQYLHVNHLFRPALACCSPYTLYLITIGMLSTRSLVEIHNIWVFKAYLSRLTKLSISIIELKIEKTF